MAQVIFYILIEQVYPGKPEAAVPALERAQPRSRDRKITQRMLVGRILRVIRHIHVAHGLRDRLAQAYSQSDGNFTFPDSRKYFYPSIHFLAEIQ
ncbi:hypothetical protein [Gabonia massiliensis]|uniref:hypothetical protein n=1 Tax=Gabonia massiliensis TaxID=1686296 RepID=UPI00214BC15E|nr:hypothetical protein [Gabonia massiliensis]